MERIPGIVLEQLRKPTAEGHPDANALTAFAERSLPASERGRMMEHLARCGDCREVISLSLPADEALPLPVVVGSNWLRWPVLRWAAVAAGVAVIASVGAVQYRRQHVVESAFLHPNRTTAVAGSRNPVGSAGPSVKADRAFANETTADNKIQDKLIQNQREKTARKRVFPDAEVVGKAKAPVAAQAANRAAPLASPAIPLQTSPALMLHASPRWAINSSGGLQRSFDGGNTWEIVVPNAAPDAKTNQPELRKGVAGFGGASQQRESAPEFRAVATNGLEVWAGGAGGVLYHTMDGGNRWIRVTPATAVATLAGDIVSIEFLTGGHCAVTTSAPEIWTTADAGQSWQRQP